MEKQKRVKIETEDGTKYITYRPVESIPEKNTICNVYCRYSKICGRIPDPRNMDDEDSSYLEFCNSLGDNLGVEEDEKTNNKGTECLSAMIPIEGSLEELYKDRKDILQIIIGKDPIYKLSDIIDNCCPGICEFYSADHSDCSIDNGMCILRGLLLNKKTVKKESGEN